MAEFNDNNEIRCSFCGKSQSEVKRIIAGAGVYICNECIGFCKELIDNEDDYVGSEEHQAVFSDVPTPHQIKAALDEYVIGQDDAKKILSVAVYNHYKRINCAAIEDDEDNNGVELQKSNILLLGPTGCGKTLLAQTLAKILEVPFAMADATTLTEAGYVGEDVENILLKLLQAADMDIEKAERGIIYVDEIDKISRKSANPSLTRDVSGEGVQQALLKIIEGTVANIPPQGGRKHPHQEFLQMDTSGILFICGGAFDGMEEVISRRMEKGSQSIGFGANIQSEDEKDKNALLQQTEPRDLLSYGLIPEFIGRIPVIAPLDHLDRAALMRILVEPKNAVVKQFKKMLDMEDVELVFNVDALEAIADKALENETGARGLRGIIEGIMKDIMFDVPSEKDIDKIIITRECVTENAAPVIYRSRAMAS